MDKRFSIEDQIDMLAMSLKGEVIAPRHTQYDAVRHLPHGNWDPRPAAVIRPANAADVAAVINFARATDLPLAIRSGGHSVSGHSGCDGGLVLDLRRLTAFDIDAEAHTAWIGAGLTAGEVTRTLEAQGLIIGFGDSGTVGVSGLTLGGGIGFLARKHGLTIDSLLAADVVTAEGDIIMADATHHPDLFWALRGGGGNFGVVTRLKFRLHDLPEFVGGPLILPVTPEVLAGFAAAAKAAPEELTGIGLVITAPPLPFLAPELHGKIVMMAMMAYAGPAADAAAALAPFRALATPYADLIGPAPLSSLYLPEEPDMRPSVAIRTLFTDGFDVAMAARMLAELDKCDAPVRMLQIRVLGGAVARVDDGATAFAHRQSGMLLAFLALYEGTADIPRHEKWVSDALAAIRTGETDRAYVNFVAAEGTERLRAAYPDATMARLRQVKASYDPENLFRFNHNIVPA